MEINWSSTSLTGLSFVVSLNFCDLQLYSPDEILVFSLCDITTLSSDLTPYFKILSTNKCTLLLNT